MLVCVGMYWYVLVCADVLVYVCMCWHVVMCRYVLVCIGMRWGAFICVGKCWYLLYVVLVCVVCDCK